jgi:hypothetical protein
VISDTFHLVAWVDHKVARLYAITHEHIREIATIYVPDIGGGNIHHKAGSPEGGHNQPPAAFLHEIATGLENGQEILIAGPADAKFALKRYLETHAPLLAARVVGVEPMDSDEAGEIHEFAYAFFYRSDRIRPKA